MKIENNKYKFKDRDFFLKLFGENVYAVGGFVRDLFLGKVRDDVDLLIVKEDIDSIIEKLKPHGKVDVVGKNFGIVLFTKDGINYEIALPRIDIADTSKRADHKNFIVKADPNLPIEKDLERRDFVCNSMALHLKSGELIDPFGGVKDIEKKILRMTNEKSFFDDPLRILRAARFASTLEFELDGKIYPKANETDLTGLSMERITEEFFKMIIRSKKPSIGFWEYFKLGVLKQLFPELFKLTLTIQDSKFHPETDEQGHHTVWAHTMLVVDNASFLAKNERFDFDETERLILILGALFHDIGKISTTEWNWKRGRMTITSNNHDFVGEKIVENIFKRFNIIKYKGYKMKELVKRMVRFHHRIHDLWKNREFISKKSVARIYLEFKDDIKYLLILDISDKEGRGQGIPATLDERGEWFLEMIDKYELNKETINPLIMGRDLIALGMKPGPAMGEVLKELYELQLEDRFKTKEEGLEFAKKYIKDYIFSEETNENQ